MKNAIIFLKQIPNEIYLEQLCFENLFLSDREQCITQYKKTIYNISCVAQISQY